MTELADELARWRRELGDRDPQVRLRAGRALLRVGSLDGRRAILDACTNEQPWIREEATAVLGDVGAYWALEPLAARAKDDSAYVRREAIVGLWQTHSLDAVSHLASALTDPDEPARLAAHAGLIAITGVSFDDQESAADWWTAHHQKMNGLVRYDRGEPLCLGRWVAELETRSIDVAAAVQSTLVRWTGVILSKDHFDWRRWWSNHADRFVTGKRYHYGRDADTLATGAVC